MGTPITSNQYEFARVATLFKAQIEHDYNLKDTEVSISYGNLVNLNGDGVQNDFAGSAILKVGRSFKSFIFLMRDDGSIRFLEKNGFALDPEKGRSVLSCGSKPVACPDTMERAKQQITGTQFYVTEYDKSKDGLEVIIPMGGGRYNILNSLELFAK